MKENAGRTVDLEGQCQGIKRGGKRCRMEATSTIQAEVDGVTTIVRVCRFHEHGGHGRGFVVLL